ncbi:MAG: PASTA domain-containing protein [Syntrophomonas sp.]
MIGAGTVLSGRYEIIELVSEGGMAMVYKARCRILDRIVAVKILKDEYSSDLNFVQKFKTEGLAAAQLSHPNIVNIYDVGQEEDIYYIVMEFIEGETLKEYILREAPLPVNQAITIATMICDGLQHAHEKGIIHRDIKPHNIIITETGIVKVADFGIAKAISKKTITYGGNIVGSVHYIAPEQARGEPVTRTTDIYSLGCVIYEMLTGKMPFDAESPITVALKHIHDDPVPPRSFNSEIPKALEAVILRAMAKNPVQRFASAQDLRNALLPYCRSVAADFGNEGYRSGTPRKTLGKRRLKKSTWIVIGIALLALVSGFFMSSTLFGKEVEVPDVVSLKVTEANQKLTDLKLKVTVVKASSDQPADTVIAQKPPKGQKVKEGREIEITVSTGAEQATVPQVVAKTGSEAELEIRGAGFVPKSQEQYDDKWPENTVISQKPNGNTQAAKGSTVTILVSKGKSPGKVKMPNLLGMTLEQATKLIQDNDLVIGTTTREPSSEYYINQVCKQSVAAGTMVDQKSTVNISLSTGPGPVAQSRQYTYTLPTTEAFYQVVIRVTDTQGTRDVYNQPHRGGDTVVTAINYFGAAKVEVFLNGKSVKKDSF